MTQQKKQSTGVAGETAAQFLFNKLQWKMYRHQPPTRYIVVKNRPVIVPCKTNGMPDFTGYTKCTAIPLYRACEVKEANGKSMPASRLSTEQREFLRDLPNQSSYVCILWDDGLTEIFYFVPRGRYVKGAGVYR